MKQSLDAEECLIVPVGEDFITSIQGLNEQQIRDFGPACAREWQQQTVEGVCGKGTEQEGDETGIESLFTDFPITKPSAFELERVDWEAELVKGLLVDVDEEMEKEKIVVYVGSA